MLVTMSVAACAALDSSSVDDDVVIDSVLLRTALVGSDVEASKRFYSYALGYEIGFDDSISGPDVFEKRQLEKGQTVHFVVLRGAKSIDGRELTGAMIGLMQVDNPPLPRMSRPGPESLATGEGMMAIVSSDIATVYERVLELDARVLLPLTLSADESESEMVVYDPDGIRVHVVEVHRARLSE